MKRFLPLSFVLVAFCAASLAALAVSATGSADDDPKAIQGMWMPIKAELGGKPLPDALLKTITLKLEDGKYDVHVGDEPDRGTYTLDSTAQPKAITITGTEGPNRGKTYPAIYDLKIDQAKGDTLRICYDLSGAKRPTEFKTAAGTKLYLVAYRRKNP